ANNFKDDFEKNRQQ
nr:25-kda elastin-binding protein [Staphylococcus aureus, Peptide Partial, 14 aa] [Staphylococcus aureus]